MTLMREQVRQRLKVDEGLRLKPYLCTAGKTTIGYGRNLEDRGITVGEAEMLLDNDIDAAERDARSFTMFQELNDARQGVMVCLAFNLGISRLLAFKKFLAAAKAGNHIEAANELRNSKWFTQVGQRAERLCRIWLTGHWE